MNSQNENCNIENPYSPPSDSFPSVNDIHIESERQSPRALATYMERFLGSLIDGIISIVCMLGVILLVTKVADILGSPDIEEVPGVMPVLVILGGPIGFLLIHGRWLHASGQTVGKKLMKTAIVECSGAKPSLVYLLLLRYTSSIVIFYMVPGIGLLVVVGGVLMILGKNRRCLHDYIAGTKVVSLVRSGDEEEQMARAHRFKKLK